MGAERWTEEQLQAHLGRMEKARENLDSRYMAKEPKAKRSKYGNRKVLVTFAQPEIVAGHTRLCHEFDSQKEANQYADLCLLRQSGQIDGLVLQRPYPLIAYSPHGDPRLVGEWYADFYYLENGSAKIVDVKSPGTRTQTYQLKKKIVEACHDITITEV